MIVSRFIAAALLSGVATALPHRVRDSAINEPAVSAPDGTPITEGTQPTQTALDVSATTSVDSAAATSTTVWDSTSSTVWDSTSSTYTAGWESTSTADASSSYETPTYQAPTYQAPTYGSGSSNWGSSGNSNYNDCVSQCLAQYGSAPQPWTPPTPTNPENVGSVGTGATHTVIVAPTQGVLRYVPFAINASMGDVVRFVWGADNHTVTKSSQLTPCNNTLDSPFASGLQTKGFTFDQVVNDTNPTFVHCTVPTHCQKGMFAIINPPSIPDSASSVAMMMSTWTQSDPNLSAYQTYSTGLTQNSTSASNWGGHINVASMPEWAHPYIAENVLYTRAVLGVNSQMMDSDGNLDLSNPSNMMLPRDISVDLSNSGSAAPASSVTAGTSGASAATTEATASSTPANLTSGAMTTSPRFVAALVAAAASFFLL